MNRALSDDLPDRKIYWPETIVRAALAAGVVTQQQADAALAEMQRILKHNSDQEAKPIRWPWKRGQR